MADLIGVNPELRERVEWMIAASQNRLWITYGFRDIPDQWRFWNLYTAAKKEHPLTWRNYAALAAYPGTSMHGKTNPDGSPNALAVDVGCLESDKKLRANLANQAGLCTPVPGEPWHMQLAAGRGPLPPGTVEERKRMVIEPVAFVPHPKITGSGWEFGRKGHVYAVGDARHWGPDSDSKRASGDVVALVPANDGLGYTLVNSLGQCFSYGTAQWPGNYRADLWGEGSIVGAFVNDRIPNGGTTMVRDDGQNLNLYALPA